MADKRTYRRVPKDVAEAKYISGLIDADVKGRSKELTEKGDFGQLRELLNTQESWRGIVENLETPSAASDVVRVTYPNTLKREEPAPQAVAPAPEGGAATTKSRAKNA